MSTEHTPGPWTAREWRGHSPTTVVCETGHPDLRPEVFVIAEVEGRGDDAEAIANARLIAAAPDLLELAKQYASECAECDGVGIGPCDQCADIRAVIEKAQAQHRTSEEDYDPTPWCNACGPKSACTCGPIADNE